MSNELHLWEKIMLRHILFLFGCLLTGLSVYGQSAYREAITQGLRFQMQADSIQRLAEAQVMALAQVSEPQKNGVKNVIQGYESQAAALQKQADEWFARAVAFEEKTPVNTAAENVSETDNAIEIIETADVSKNDETRCVPKSEFAILPKSPYTATNPVPVDEPLPDGVAYKIQLGAFSKPISPNTFKGLMPLSGEKLANGITKYYVGLFLRFSDADDALRKVREYGFKDAFIVAFYNRKTINPERVKQLEN